MPKVLNIRDCGGQIPEGAVYIGRARKNEFNKWGNPFVMRSERDRNLVIRNFKEWFYDQPKLVEEAKVELAGRDLVCFCYPKACHGDVIMEAANS